MAIGERQLAFKSLELSREFEDLEGLVEADLRAIVTMLTERAHERLFLTRREFRQLQARLWNDLIATVQEAVEPLSAEYR